MSKVIGQADFIRLCNAEDWHGDWDRRDGEAQFKVALDGVYVSPLPDKYRELLFTEEVAVFSDHPLKDLTEPALSFPCTIPEFKSFVEWAGLVGCYDEEMINDLHQFLQGNKGPTATNRKPPSNPSGCPKGTLREALEYLWDDLSAKGETEVLKGQNSVVVLRYLKKMITEGSDEFTDYIAERIAEVKPSSVDCVITTQNRPEIKGKRGKSVRYSKKQFQDTLSIIRMSYQK